MTRPPPLISLRAASFRRALTSPPIFPNTTFTLPAPPTPEKWTILGPSKSTFLTLLRGSLHAVPPTSRHLPPLTKIQHVSFGSTSASGLLRGGTGGDAYVSARYETLRERFDQTLQEWLESSLESDYNPYENPSPALIAAEEAENKALLGRVMKELHLAELKEQAVMTLSNGQSRRARIAQALLKRPKVLLLDEPFMGLDPNGHQLLAALLERMGGGEGTAVVLGLRPQDPVPAWTTHLAYVEDEKVVAQGGKEEVVEQLKGVGKRVVLEGEEVEARGVVEKAWAGVGNLPVAKEEKKPENLPEPLVEMENVKIAYFGDVILKDFSWTIRRGEKWGLFGPNGSGKTTLTALLTSDHPLTYSLPIRHFSRPRLPQPGQRGISIFEIQSRIGLSSPEVHSFFPRHLSLRRCILSGFAPTFLTAPVPTPAEKAHVASLMEEFKDLVPKGDWEVQFGDADMSTQRLALFLRAAAPKRDLVVFDEAFSGMRAEVRERCFALLETERGWEEGRQAMVVVSHVSEEVPRGVGRFVRLGERGGREGAVFGEL